VAKRYLFACPCKLEPLFNIDMSAQTFHEDVIVWLAWLGFGSIASLLSLPFPYLLRLSTMVREDNLMDTYRDFRKSLHE
jgi:hypothetical protein